MSILFDHIRDFRGFKKEALEILHTQQLLNLLAQTRSIPDYVYDFEDEDVLSNLTTYTKILKDILATREHIPNKLERKQIRLNKVKNKNHDGKQIRKR